MAVISSSRSQLTYLISSSAQMHKKAGSLKISFCRCFLKYQIHKRLGPRVKLSVTVAASTMWLLKLQQFIEIKEN